MGTFTAALFIVVKRGKPPKSLRNDEWINEPWHSRTVEYYAAAKKWSIDTRCSMNEPCKQYAQGKQSVTEDQVLYDFIFKKCPEQANLVCD